MPVIFGHRLGFVDPAGWIIIILQFLFFCGLINKQISLVTKVDTSLTKIDALVEMYSEEGLKFDNKIKEIIRVLSTEALQDLSYKLDETARVFAAQRLITLDFYTTLVANGLALGNATGSMQREIVRELRTIKLQCCGIED